MAFPCSLRHQAYAELWFGLYWILTQALRWNQVYRSTFKDRLSQRYEKELPGVDIFVCTADPQIEPPMMWDSYSSRQDHDTILQILIDGKDPLAIDIEGCALPTLVYLAREKRPQHPHNFKAGAMNSLIRVSSKISNGPVEFHVMRRTLNGEMRWV
ncbi:hypothetical protein QYF36_001859 [Acer negundo]|nr:hypothetical protein QYF36_001859 [Acer negundo]